MEKIISIPLPIIMTKEGKWFVAGCPLLDIATQGKTEEEVKENMTDLIKDYLSDPDTPKPKVKTMMTSTITITNIPIKISDDFNGEIKTAITA